MMILIGCGAPPSETSSAPSSPGKTAPTSPEADHLNVGIDALQKGDVRVAIQQFDAAIKSNPAALEGYLILGETYMRLNEYARAVDTYIAATRVAPEQGELYYLLALNYGLMGDKTSSLTNIQKSIEIFRNNQDEANFIKSMAFLQGLIQSEETVSEEDVSSADQTGEEAPTPAAAP